MTAPCSEEFRSTTFLSSSSSLGAGDGAGISICSRKAVSRSLAHRAQYRQQLATTVLQFTVAQKRHWEAINITPKSLIIRDYDAAIS
jgi:hypothetical protein